MTIAARVVNALAALDVRAAAALHWKLNVIVTRSAVPDQVSAAALLAEVSQRYYTMMLACL